MIFHDSWHDALQSEYLIRADRQEATEVSSICPPGLSRVRKLLRERNCGAIFSSLKDEPGSPERKLAVRQGTSQESGVKWHLPRHPTRFRLRDSSRPTETGELDRPSSFPRRRRKILGVFCWRSSCMCVLNHFSRVQFFVTLWTVSHQLLCPWDSLGKNTGVGCHFLLRKSLAL